MFSIQLDMNMSESSLEVKASSYVVLLSGTHVTCKETLAVSLSKLLCCSWIKVEMVLNSAIFGARSQANRGYDDGEVLGRIWFPKIRRTGFLPDGNESDGESEIEPSPRRNLNVALRESGERCTALISCYAMREPARDAIREVMLPHSIRPVFVIMQITEETLSGRTCRLPCKARIFLA